MQHTTNTIDPIRKFLVCSTLTNEEQRRALECPSQTLNEGMRLLLIFGGLVLLMIVLFFYIGNKQSQNETS